MTDHDPETTGAEMEEVPRDAPWTSDDVTTEDDVVRNTHSVESARVLRRRVQELESTPAG